MGASAPPTGPAGGSPGPRRQPSTVSSQSPTVGDADPVSQEALAILFSSSMPSVRRPVRVVYFVEGYSFGGVERHLLHLVDALDRQRFEPVVLGVMADELEEELNARHLPPVRLERIRGNADLPGFVRAFRAIREARPVVFHAMLSHSFAAQYALLAAIALRTPVIVITAHLPVPSENHLRRFLRRLILRGVDVEVLPSEWTRAELTRLGQLHVSNEIVANGIALPVLLPPRRPGSNWASPPPRR